MPIQYRQALGQLGVDHNESRRKFVSQQPSRNGRNTVTPWFDFDQGLAGGRRQQGKHEFGSYN